MTEPCGRSTERVGVAGFALMVLDEALIPPLLYLQSYKICINTAIVRYLAHINASLTSHTNESMAHHRSSESKFKI